MELFKKKLTKFPKKKMLAKLPKTLELLKSCNSSRNSPLKRYQVKDFILTKAPKKKKTYKLSKKLKTTEKLQ